MVMVGIAILASGLDQPLILLVIAGCVAAFMMFLYSGLLIALNRRMLAPPLRPRGYRVVALAWAVVLFGALSAVVVVDQLRRLGG